jgi:hypothetical protein
MVDDASLEEGGVRSRGFTGERDSRVGLEDEECTGDVEASVRVDVLERTMPLSNVLYNLCT